MARVRELIELTSRHGSLREADVDREAALFLDCDMAILGAERPRFIVYEQAIRAEYAHIWDAAFRAGRIRFLRRLLELPSIFLSSTFRERYEVQARQNIAWALAQLSEPT
jgi:predicted metal-dependent HD superfamily phosphohydrolase